MTTRRALCVVVVGRSPEKMKAATAVLRSGDFPTIAAFSEEQAHPAIAARHELFAIVTGGAIDQPARDRLRAAAARKGAVLSLAHCKLRDRKPALCEATRAEAGAGAPHAVLLVRLAAGNGPEGVSR